MAWNSAQMNLRCSSDVSRLPAFDNVINDLKYCTEENVIKIFFHQLPPVCIFSESILNGKLWEWEELLAKDQKLIRCFCVLDFFMLICSASSAYNFIPEVIGFLVDIRWKNQKNTNVVIWRENSSGKSRKSHKLNCEDLENDWIRFFVEFHLKITIFLSNQRLW